MGSKKSGAKDYIAIKVHLILTNEFFNINFVTPELKIKELRGLIELETGIPYDLQKLTYLDQATLPDATDVRHNDIVPGAILTMDIWYTWRELIEAVISNEVEWLERLGVTKNSEYKTPSSEYMLPKQRQVWSQNRANMALFLASHRGYELLCSRLLSWGADINATTPLGRTALHVSAAQNHGKVINLLLNSGADVDKADLDGLNALAIAGNFGHKSCEQHLFMFRWQERAKEMKPQFLNPPLMSFQRCDSNYPKWRRGPQAQMYLVKLQPPGEFIGSAINAPKRNWHRRSSLPKSTTQTHEEEVNGVSRTTSAKPLLSYEEWHERKLKQDREKRKAAKLAEKAANDAKIEKKLFAEEKNKSYEKWMGSNPNVSDGKDGVGGGSNDTYLGTAGVTFPPLSNDKSSVNKSQSALSPEDLNTRIRQVLSRYALDPNLTCYEQWLKNRAAAASKDSGLLINRGSLPYQDMIREFCNKFGTETSS